MEAQLEREGVEPSGEGDSHAHEVERSATRSMSGSIGGLRLRTRGARKSSLGRSLVCPLTEQSKKITKEIDQKHQPKRTTKKNNQKEQPKRTTKKTHQKDQLKGPAK